MTKTLTEQWREGKLPDGAYYILVDKYEQNESEIDIGVCYNSNFEWWIVKEVLSAVPSYEEYKELTQKVSRLEFDNEALEMSRDELVQKMHILEKQLARTKTKEYVVRVDWFSPDPTGFLSAKQTQKMFGSWKKKKGVK